MARYRGAAASADQPAGKDHNAILQHATGKGLLRMGNISPQRQAKESNALENQQAWYDFVLT